MKSEAGIGSGVTVKLRVWIVWHTWKFQIKHLLLVKGLRSHVDGTAVLVDDATKQQQAQFAQQSQRAFSAIVLATDTGHLYIFSSCEGPQEAWQDLKDNFEQDTLANKLFLKKQYF